MADIKIYVYSNDGSDMLWNVISTTGMSINFSVTETGVDIVQSGSDETLAGDYAYNYAGDRSFKGLATSANATEPTRYKGTSFNIVADDEDIVFYVVEGPARPDENPETKVIYDGGIIATLNPGDIASINCKGDKMKSDVIVNVGSGGAVVNGIVREYVADVGESISAGDFVKFVNKIGYDNFTDNVAYHMTAVSLDDDKLVVFYSDAESINRHAYAVVVSCANNSLNVGTPVELTDYLVGVTKSSALVLPDTNKILFTFASSDRYNWVVKILSVTNTSISMGEEVELDIGMPELAPMAALSDDRVVIAGRSKIQLLSVNDDNVGVISTTSDSSFRIPLVINVLSNDTIVIQHCDYSDDHYYRIYKIVDNEFAYINRFMPGMSTARTGEGGNFIKALSEDRVLILSFSDFVDETQIYAFIIGVGEANMGEYIKHTKVFSRMHLNGGEYWYFDNFIALTENKLLYSLYSYVDRRVHTNHIVEAEIIGEDVVFGSPTDISLDFSNVEELRNQITRLVPLGGSSALLLGQNGECESLTIIGTNVFIDSDHPEGYAQTATTDQTNLGVAKTSGIEGETIEVYRVQ